MRPSTLTPISFEQLTSTGTGNVKTATIPTGTSAVLVSVETTNARVTFEGTAPDATHGHVLVKDLEPVQINVGSGTTIKFASTAAANSVVGLTYLS